ncbi:lumican [Spea bombifrons]|uniref:lumican n=1 Tax=Spea bombifrons TaxID=233779 RepID=UPI00234A13BC|nr:lumican [Spea bombifrons]
MHLYSIPFFALLIPSILCQYSDYDYGAYPSPEGYDYSNLAFGPASPNCAPECNCPANYPTAMYCNNLKLKKIPTIPPGIQYLYLQENLIEGIDDDTFNNVTDLKWLILSNNFLSNANIKKNAFSKLKQLQKLHINFNNLTELVGPLPKTLDDLQASNNKISKITPNILEGLENLTIIHLQHNALKQDSISGAFKGLKSLTYLDLSYNQLTKVPMGLPPSITMLYLDNNKITNIPDEYFQGFKALQYLRLSNNQLSDSGVPGNAFNISTLLELDLSFNNLGSIPAVNEGLENLYLHVNKIQKFTLSSFCKVVGPLEYSRIKHLRLDGNNITRADLPQEMYSCLRTATDVELE